MMKLFNTGKGKLLKFDPTFISLDELKDKSIEQLRELSFIKELISFLDNSARFANDFLLFFKFKDDFHIDLFKEYRELKIKEIPSDITNKDKAIYIFREKLKVLL
jgi:hypothetical protein